MAFVLADKVEALTIQMTTLYSIDKLVTRPLFLILVLAVIGLLVFGVTRKSKLEYA